MADHHHHLIEPLPPKKQYNRRFCFYSPCNSSLSAVKDILYYISAFKYLKTTTSLSYIVVLCTDVILDVFYNVQTREICHFIQD